MRAPQNANYLRPMGKVGQVTCLKCNILDAKKIEDYLDDVEVVINLVGILAEDTNQKFYQIHSLGAKNIAQACFNQKIKHFIHISALGIDNAMEQSKRMCESDYYYEEVEPKIKEMDV